MQYFVMFTPKKTETSAPPSDFQEVEPKEEARVRELYADGGLR